MIEQLQTNSPSILGFRLTGRLRDEDYRVFIPMLDGAISAEGRLRLLALFDDFHGWDLQAAWDDLVFGIRHYSDFDRIALVGDQRWQEWMALFCKPFTQAAVRYFDASELDAAWAWLREGT